MADYDVVVLGSGLAGGSAALEAAAAGEDTVHLKKPGVLRPVASNQPVPGLFAGGECTGGVLGDVYVGSGNALASALVFGRVAGRSAAHAATSGGTTPPNPPEQAAGAVAAR